MVDLSGTAGTLVLAAGGAVVAAVALQSDSVRGAVNEATGPGYNPDIQAPEPVPLPTIEPEPVGEAKDKSTVPTEISGVTSNARTASPALQDAIMGQSRVSVVRQTGPNEFQFTGD